MNTHLLPVPFEIAELINSFAYYDFNSMIRLRKEQWFMKDLIHRMIHCYNNPMDNHDQSLVIWLSVPPDEREHQFQPYFCLKCGNYIHSNTRSLCTRCTC